METPLIVYILQLKHPKTNVSTILTDLIQDYQSDTKTKTQNYSTNDASLDKTALKLDNGIKTHDQMIRSINVQILHRALIPWPHTSKAQTIIFQRRKPENTPTLSC